MSPSVTRGRLLVGVGQQSGDGGHDGGKNEVVLVHFLCVSMSLNMHEDHPLNGKGKVLMILGEGIK